MALKHALIYLSFFGVIGAAAERELICDAEFAPEFAKVLRAEPLLLQNGGAKLIEVNGVRYFVAVGVTSVREETPAERIRQLRVGRINALRAAAEFTSPVEVTSESSLRETTSIHNTKGVKTAETRKVYDENTRTKLEAILRVPSQIGSWKSTDRKLFFYAIGAKLP